MYKDLLYPSLKKVYQQNQHQERKVCQMIKKNTFEQTFLILQK